MGKSTISTYQLFEMFPDQETAREYLEERRWHGHVSCPHCGGCDKITARKGSRLGILPLSAMRRRVYGAHWYNLRAITRPTP